MHYRYTFYLLCRMLPTRRRKATSSASVCGPTAPWSSPRTEVFPASSCTWTAASASGPSGTSTATRSGCAWSAPPLTPSSVPTRSGRTAAPRWRTTGTTCPCRTWCWTVRSSSSPWRVVVGGGGRRLRCHHPGGLNLAIPSQRLPVDLTPQHLSLPGSNTW